MQLEKEGTRLLIVQVRDGFFLSIVSGLEKRGENGRRKKGVTKMKNRHLWGGFGMKDVIDKRRGKTTSRNDA